MVALSAEMVLGEWCACLAWLSALLGRVFERESMTDHTGEHER